MTVVWREDDYGVVIFVMWLALVLVLEGAVVLRFDHGEKFFGSIEKMVRYPKKG